MEKDYLQLIKELPGVISVSIESNLVEHTNPLSIMPPVYKPLPYYDIKIVLATETYKRENIQFGQLEEIYKDIKYFLSNPL